MARPAGQDSPSFDQRFLSVVVISIAAILFIVTAVSIWQSRNESYDLLVRQGRAFTNGLAEGASNAITAENYYDRLQTKRYSDLVIALLDASARNLTQVVVSSFVQDHDLAAAYLFGVDSSFKFGCSERGAVTTPPTFVKREVEELIASPESPFTQLLDQDEKTGEMVQYYLEVLGDFNCVIVLAADAKTYSDALRETGIGFLAQRMAKAQDVEYIIYQTTEGIVFSSREPGKLLAIESDPFLSGALDDDTVSNRVYEFQGQKVLEIVRPFATPQYKYGLLRVGVSLDAFYAASRAFNLQMIILSIVLLALVAVALLYFRGRRKRHELSRDYSRIKVLTDKIFEQMKVGAAVIDESGKVQLANASFDSAFGVSRAAGRRWDDLISHPELSLNKLVADDRTSAELELEYVTGGSVKNLLVARSRVTFPDQSGTSIVLVVYDVTKFRHYQREASRKERLSEMGNLAAGVAHEIRNPLNTISIAAQRLATEFKPVQDSDEYLAFTQKIRAEASRLNDIVTKFLSLAREREKQAVTMDLGQVVRDAVALVKVEAEQLGITIELSTDTPALIAASPDDLRQVLLNLYNNAKEAFRGAPGRITITTDVHGQRVILRFSDNGPGIPKELRTQIFAPYFTTKDAGTGLGLATVYKTITELGGEVTAEETEGGGATFVIKLSLRTPSPGSNPDYR